MPLVTSAKAILLVAVAVSQGDTSVTRLFPARPTGYVTDLANAIDAATRGRIDQLSERLRGATGAELATVVLPTIGDRAPVEVATTIGRVWGVGAQAAVGDQRRNAGLVILLVPRRQDDDNSGHIFIATGNGLEGIVTDLQAGRVRDLMVPFFQRREYGAGLEAGVRALASLIAQGMGVSDSALNSGANLLPRQPAAGSERRGPLFWLGVALLIIFLIARLSKSGGGGRGGRGRRRRRSSIPWIFMGGGGGRGGGGFGGFGGFGGGGGGGGFGGFGGGGGFSGGGAGGRF